MLSQNDLKEKIKSLHDELVNLIENSFNEADYYYWHAFKIFQEEFEKKYGIKIMNHELEQIFNSLVNEIYGGMNDDILNILRTLKYQLQELTDMLIEKILEKGPERAMKDMLIVIRKKMLINEQYNDIVINKLKKYIDNIILKIEELKKNTLLTKILHPVTVKVFSKIGIEILEFDPSYEEFINEVHMILSPDHIVGVTSIEEAIKFIMKISEEKNIKYREIPSDILQSGENYVVVPSNVKYPRITKEIVRILKPCIILYPNNPAPLMIKKQSANLGVLIAHMTD